MYPLDSVLDLTNYFIKILELTDKKLPLFIGGKSLGGRIASHMVSRTDLLSREIAGCIALGYPFHAYNIKRLPSIDHR